MDLDWLETSDYGGSAVTMVGKGEQRVFWEIPHDQPAQSDRPWMDMNAWLWAYCEITFSSLGRGWVTVCSWPHTALLLMALSENRGCQPQGNTPRLGHACREALV